MALKRSGVRASFAPSIYFGCARLQWAVSLSGFFPVFSFHTRFLPLLGVLVGFLVGAGSVPAQKTSPRANTKNRTDVVLFIGSGGPTTARIGLAYRKLLPHAQVRQEIKSLLAASGWKLNGDLSITDKTVHPEDPVRFPPVTGALFSLADAPQLHDNAPVLSPYLKAFQAWDHLEILFAASDIQPYNGITNFHASELDVTLAKSDGLYRYIVTIREHHKELPVLIPDEREPSVASSGRVAPTIVSPQEPIAGTLHSGPSLFWPYLFIVAGGLMIFAVGLYLLAKRDHRNMKPGRLR